MQLLEAISAISGAADLRQSTTGLWYIWIKISWLQVKFKKTLISSQICVSYSLLWISSSQRWTALNSLLFLFHFLIKSVHPVSHLPWCWPGLSQGAQTMSPKMFSFSLFWYSGHYGYTFSRHRRIPRLLWNLKCITVDSFDRNQTIFCNFSVL